MTYWKYRMLKKKEREEKENSNILQHEKSFGKAEKTPPLCGKLTCRQVWCSPGGFGQSNSRLFSPFLWVPGAHSHRRGQCQRNTAVWRPGSSMGSHPSSAYSSHSNLLVKTWKSEHINNCCLMADNKDLQCSTVQTTHSLKGNSTFHSSKSDNIDCCSSGRIEKGKFTQVRTFL